MFKTQFLTDEREGMKSFNALNTYQVSSKRITPEMRAQTFGEISQTTRRTIGYRVSSGNVYLPFTNRLYCIEHLPYHSDIVLPKALNILDWVVLFYEQTTLALNVSREYGQRQTFKLYSTDKQRIMGLDEPLNCDMPFMSLRLTFLGDIDGWAVS